MTHLLCFCVGQCPTCVTYSKDGKEPGAGEEVVVERVPLAWAAPTVTFNFEVRPAPASSIVEKCVKDEVEHAEEQDSKRLKKSDGSIETSAVEKPKVEEAQGAKNKIKATKKKVKKLKRRHHTGRGRGVVCADFECSVCKEPGPTVKSREGTQEDAAFCKKPECWRTVGDVSLLTGFHGQPLCIFCLQGFEKDGKKTFVAARATFRQQKTNIPSCAGHYYGRGNINFAYIIHFSLYFTSKLQCIYIYTCLQTYTHVYLSKHRRSEALPFQKQVAALESLIAFELCIFLDRTSLVTLWTMPTASVITGSPWILCAHHCSSHFRCYF